MSNNILVFENLRALFDKAEDCGFVLLPRTDLRRAESPLCYTNALENTAMLCLFVPEGSYWSKGPLFEKHCLLIQSKSLCFLRDLVIDRARVGGRCVAFLIILIDV